MKKSVVASSISLALKKDYKMKKSVVASSISLAFVLVATTASADYPEVTIDSEIYLNYDQEIDLSGAVNVPTVDMGDDADVSVNQFNHDSPVFATGDVSGNMGANGSGITDLHVDVTAVGNNASIDIASDNTVIGAVQGNQNGGATAVGSITRNRIDLDKVINEDGDLVDGIVELNVTAVGNNLTVASANGDGLDGTQIGSVQFNYDSPVTATGYISGNGFGINPVSRDPKLVVTAVGNNLTSVLGTTGSMLQVNRNSTVSARGYVSRNRGDIGPVSVNVSAVGNNISIKAPTVD